MREIKFRAWDNKDKKWLLGYEYPSLGGFSMYGETILLGEYSNVLDEFLFSRSGKKPEDFILMQYTGLKDKNGKEIYEGDILKWTHPNFKELKKEYKILEMSDIRKSLMLEPDCAHGWIEIIGNIYENKELLK